MEPDLVAAMAEAVEQLQLRRVLVRQPALLDGLGSAKLRAIGRKPVIRPAGTVDRGGILQRMVGGEEVVILQRRRLVQHLVGVAGDRRALGRSEEHTSEHQSLMSITYAVFRLEHIPNNNTHYLSCVVMLWSTIKSAHI